MKIKTDAGEEYELNDFDLSGNNFITYKSKENPEKLIPAYYQISSRIRIGNLFPLEKGILFAETSNPSLFITRSNKVYYNITRWFTEPQPAGLQDLLKQSVIGTNTGNYIRSLFVGESSESLDSFSTTDWLPFVENCKITDFPSINLKVII